MIYNCYYEAPVDITNHTGIVCLFSLLLVMRGGREGGREGHLVGQLAGSTQSVSGLRMISITHTIIYSYTLSCNDMTDHHVDIVFLNNFRFILVIQYNRNMVSVWLIFLHVLIPASYSDSHARQMDVSKKLYNKIQFLSLLLFCKLYFTEKLYWAELINYRYLFIIYCWVIWTTITFNNTSKES